MKAVTLLTAMVLAASLSFAADAEKKAEETHDVSKNPITGTVTETHETATKAKGPHGEAKGKKIHKKKTHKDGSVETSTETKASTENK